MRKPPANYKNQIYCLNQEFKDAVARRCAAKMEYFSATQSLAESTKDFARRLRKLFNAAGGELNNKKGDEM